MQSITPVTITQLLAQAQSPKARIEVQHLGVGGALNYIATMPFDSGSVEPQPNEVLSGTVSIAEGTVISVTLLSGTWAAGTAAGTIDLAFCTDRFYDNENIDGDVGGANMLTVNSPDSGRGVDGYVINGGMEAVDGSEPDGWKPYGTPTNITRSGEFERTGTYDCRVAVAGAGDGMQMDTDVYPTLIEGVTYRISKWIYWRDTNPGPPTHVTFRVGITGIGTAVLSVTSVDVSVPIDTWTEVAFTAVCTTGGTIRTYAVHLATAPYYPPVFYVDDVTIYEDESWIDLSDFNGKDEIEDWTVDLGGARMDPNPIAGKFSVTINNPEGVFHPEHPSSFYATLFEEGKPVRISLGATYGGVDYYWRRITGYMEEPNYQGRTHKVKIKGYDYMKLLMDTELKKADNEIWGAIHTTNSIASGGTAGAEKYTEADAMEIGAGEANNVTNWSTLTNLTIVSQPDTGGGSTWVGKMTTTAGATHLVRNLAATDTDLVVGREYKLVFEYRRVHGAGKLVAHMRQTIGGAPIIIAATADLEAEVWTTVTLYFTALASGPLIFEFVVNDATVPDEFRVDEISIKEHTDPVYPRYDLPATATGVYRVILDSVEVFQDAQDNGWYYDPDANQFYFDDKKTIEDGVNNLDIYYYEAQTLENVVADILVLAGLYADQAAALVGMDYTATGISIDKVFFTAGDKLLKAMRLCCERANYRFFLQYDGTPDYNPPPTADAVGSEDIDLTGLEYSKHKYYRDKKEIWNRVVIEGLEVTQRVSPEEVMTSQLRGEQSDATSIAAYGEHTKVIQNHLFQDQTSLDAMAVILLALRKDPNYYFDFVLNFNATPLELGDTTRLQVVLFRGTGANWGEFVWGDGTIWGGGLIEIVKRGLIRDIVINKFNVKYKCQKVT